MARAKPQAGPQFTLAAAAGHFARDLRGDKSPKTVETYVESVQGFARFAATQGVTAVADVSPALIRDWLAAMTTAGNSDATRFNRYNGLKAFLKWAVADGQLVTNPIEGIAPPRPEVKPVAVLTEDQIKSLLRVCRGQGFEAIRDSALIRLLYDTGMRRAEAAGLKGRLGPDGSVEGDLDLDNNVAIVMGKGSARPCLPIRCPNRSGFRPLSAGAGHSPASQPRRAMARAQGTADRERRTPGASPTGQAGGH